jgi:hypothetical protein
VRLDRAVGWVRAPGPCALVEGAARANPPTHRARGRSAARERARPRTRVS